MKKTLLLSTYLCFSLMSTLCNAANPFDVPEDDLRSLNTALEAYHEIDRAFQEATAPLEHGIAIDKKALYQRRLLLLGAIYELLPDNSIIDDNERYRDLGRRVNEKQRMIKEAKRAIERELLRR